MLNTNGWNKFRRERRERIRVDRVYDRWNFQRKQEARKINVRIEAKAISILETNYLGRILAPREVSIPSNWRRKYFLRDDEDFSSRRGSEGEKSRFERSLSLCLETFSRDFNWADIKRGGGEIVAIERTAFYSSRGIASPPCVCPSSIGLVYTSYNCNFTATVGPIEIQ